MLQLDISTIITNLSIFLDKTYIYIPFLLAIVFLTEKRNEKRIKIIFAILVVSVLVLAGKYIIHKERPCNKYPSLIACPETYSFPSGHAALAFVVAIAYLDKREFPVLWLLAIAIALSRIYLGVHTLQDISGGLITAAIGYNLTDYAYRWYYGKQGN